MIQLPPIPRYMAGLPRDERGYPCPWFISWIDGKPEFRCADPRKLIRAVTEKRCWVCGEKLGRWMAFVIGPMCAINRTSSEPPSHRECAEFSVKACPFLSRPKSVRREANLPEGSVEAAGIASPRNPGVSLIWICRDYSVYPVHNGFLFSLPKPSECLWYSEGRKATRAEILESIDGGLPQLVELAVMDGDEAVADLKAAHARALELLPA